MNDSFISILLIAIGILFVPFLSRTFKIPVAVGEILYGIVIGKSFLNLVEPSPWLNFLSLFGFFLLMFIAGLEVKVKEVHSQPLKSRLVFTLIPSLVFLIAYLIGKELSLNLLTTVAMGVISVGIVVSVLREKGLLQSEFGKKVFFLGIVGEVLSIVILTFLSLYYRYGFSLSFWIGLGKLALFLLSARLVLILLKSIVWWYPDRFKFFFEKNPAEIGVRISLAVMFTLSVAASLIDIEPIIGAFIAGVIFSTVFEETENIEEKLSGISFGFLVPIFFIYVGINFVMPHLGRETLYLVGALTVGSLVSKVLPSVFLMLEGFSLRESLGAGVLLGAPLTLVIVVAELGVKMKLIDHHLESVLILVATLTGIMSPIIFNLLLGRGDENNHT